MPAVLVALIAIPAGTIKAVANGRVLEEVETTYQYARVVERPDGVRRLELNEGRAVHSEYRPGSFLTGDYWDEYLVLPFAARASSPRDVAILGNAAGTTARALGRFFPAARVDGVEIDGKLTELGRRYFDLDNPRLSVFEEDARTFLRRSDRRYDVVMVDVYRQPYIPFHLTTREFFELARDRLRPGGTVIVNVGHPKGQAALEKAISATIADVFETVLRDPSKPTNTLVLGTAAPAGPDRLRLALPVVPAELRPLAARRQPCSPDRSRWPGLHGRQGAGRVAD